MMGRVERLRWGLVAGTLVLLAVLVGAMGYSRWRAAGGWLTRMKQHSGAKLDRETDGFTYSQTVQGRTVFSLHAAKAFQHTGGVYTLRDVVLTLYGFKGDRADRIYGNEFDWDESKGIARAQGDVRMDLGVNATAALAARGGGPAAAEVQNDPRSIHVKTSGLVFLRKLDVAATSEAIEFHYGDLTCRARGAELDSSPSAVHLLADVRVEGMLSGTAGTLLASKADFDRTTNLVTLAMPSLASEARRAKADTAVLHLRANGTVETGTATGGVELADGNRQIRGQRLDAVLNERNRPVSARMTGGVQAVDSDARRPMQASAAEMRVRFGADGAAEEITGVGGVQMRAREQGPGGVWLGREAHGAQVVATMAAAGAGRHTVLRTVHATGGAGFRAESLVAGRAASAGKPASPGGVKATEVNADDLVASFAPAGGGGRGLQPEALGGTGHTMLRETGPGAGEERLSQGRELHLQFAAGERGSLTVTSAEQSGGVTLRSVAAASAKDGGKGPAVSTASADRAVLDGASQRVVLSGNARVADASAALNAGEITVNQATGDAEATGSVTGTLVGGAAGGFGLPGGGAAGARGDGAATHVAARRAVMARTAGVATFEGEGGKPARLWQGASQVEAGVITVDNNRRTLLARPGAGGEVVRSVFAGQRGGKAAAERSAGVAKGVETAVQPGTADVLRVESRSLQYSDAGRVATFEGPVRMDGAAGEVRGSRASAFFAPAGASTAGVERVVVTGGVRVQQPGRVGTGEQLVYRAADGTVTLTGGPETPPRVVDAQQGTVTGTSLMIRPGDSTIVVSGSTGAESAPPSGAEKKKGTRARIDTHVKP